MFTAILATKLFVPPARSSWVVRPRLLQRLGGVLRDGCKLALISAPAGFGKTTIVTSWIESLRAASNPARVAWVSLDPGDNDLPAFLTYLVAALQSCAPEVGAVTRSLLDQSPLPSREDLLSPLINDLAELAVPLILVLDDYHSIDQAAVHEALAFLLERLPPACHAIITTRQDPLLPLSRWRARGQAVDLRLKDLRFTPEESAEFITRNLGFPLKAEDMTLLEDRTEGWIAGLQLAAISLAQFEQSDSSGNISEFVSTFAGNNRLVMDYLMDEVLGRQPEAVQQFLLYTSLLDRFCAPLCESVLALAPALPSGEAMPPEAVLDYLDRANLFLVPLDQSREWYRYHHLFAELLQHRLRTAKGKALLSQVHQRASQWFDENDLPEEAIHYAQLAADWNLSTRLLLKTCPQFIQRGQMLTVQRWLAALPDSVLRSQPALCSYYAYTLAATSKLDLAEPYFKLAEQGLADNPVMQGANLAFSSYLSCFRGDFTLEVDQARRALDLLPGADSWMRGLAAVGLGIGLCHNGDPSGCEEAMRSAYTLGQQSGTLRTCVMALGYLGRMAALRLDFYQAEQHFRQASEFRLGGQIYPGSDMALLDTAQLKYEQNELEESLHFVERGLEVNRFSGSCEMRSYGYRLAARIYQIQGQHNLAYEYLLKAIQMEMDYNMSPLTLDLDAAMRVEMALADNNLREAEQAAGKFVQAAGLYPFIFYPETAGVHLLIVENRLEEAARLLEPALERAGWPGWEYARLQVRLLQALIEEDAVRSKQYLCEALTLAESAGAVRSFLDLGQPIYERLVALRPQLKASESAYLDKLLAIFQTELKLESVDLPTEALLSQSTLSAQPGLVEPLTEREIEVLQLLADGLSNAEIAKKLFLSPNTLKAHTQNIYSKLDVHSRMQGVNRARELGIIP